MHTAPRLWIMLFALWASACGVTVRGELTTTECRDNKDNDRDGTKDCDDPDCWVYEFCSGNDSTSTPPLGGADAAATDSNVAGSTAASDGGSAQLDAGAQPTAGNDAAPPLLCDVDGGLTCKNDESCVLGACVPATPVTSDSYVLRIPSAFVPDQTPGTICFDTVSTSGVCSVSPAFLCGNCKPDPYVITTLNEVMIAKTSVAMDTVAPAWNDPGFEVTLEAGDVLRFTVMDSDPNLSKDTLIFWCTPNIASFKTASAIQCLPDADSDTIPAIPPTQWAITIESSPRGPVAE